LRRAIQKYIEDELTEKFIKGIIQASDSVTVDMENGEIVFRKN
jgi:ATP-dependent Clp protease ATP-binding subunit ClpA